MDSGTFQKYFTSSMSQLFLSGITMCQRHIITFCTCSPLVLLRLVIFLQLISAPRLFRIQILKLEFVFIYLHLLL